MNPNWVQLKQVFPLFFFFSFIYTHIFLSLLLFNLLQKLNLNGPKASRNFNDDDAPNSILGNIIFHFFFFWVLLVLCLRIMQLPLYCSLSFFFFGKMFFFWQGNVKGGLMMMILMIVRLTLLLLWMTMQGEYSDVYIWCILNYAFSYVFFSCLFDAGNWLHLHFDIKCSIDENVVLNVW